MAQQQTREERLNQKCKERLGKKLTKVAQNTEEWLFIAIRYQDGTIECFSSPETHETVVNDMANTFEMLVEDIPENEK